MNPLNTTDAAKSSLSVSLKEIYIFVLKEKQ